MQFPSISDNWGLHYTQIIISLVSWFLAFGLQLKLFIHPIMSQHKAHGSAPLGFALTPTCFLYGEGPFLLLSC